MHGGAITLANLFRQAESAKDEPPDLILATDMLDLTTFLALTRRQTAGVPVALYMHENQLTYPLPSDGSTGPMRRQHGERDRHYGFINLVSMLAADRVFFNSRYHLEACIKALYQFLRHYPEYNEIDSVELIRNKSQVLPVGIDFERLIVRPLPAIGPPLPPLILWNQRLEYDKNPEEFLTALTIIAREGYSFRVAICGERFGRQDEQFTFYLNELGDRVIHNGYANDELYKQHLWTAGITISTADHEYFGVSVLEAIYAGTFPLLPNRLSYPEIIPPTFHSRCLYSEFDELLSGLRWALTDPLTAGSIARELAGDIARYDWRETAPEYDRALDRLMI